MKQKTTYEAPLVELVEVSLNTRFLDTSVGTTSTEELEKLNGFWD